MTSRTLAGPFALATLIWAALASPLLAAPERPYPLDVTAALDRASGTAAVELAIGAGSGVEWFRFRLPDPSRYAGFRAEGKLERLGADVVLWRPPASGGRLRYQLRIDHLRPDGQGRYDAFCGEDYALLRGDDLVPPARVRARVGARSRTRLRLALPPGWQAVTPYPRRRDGTWQVESEHVFARPTGWLLAGVLDRRREVIAGVAVTIASPVGADPAAADLLRFLRQTLPPLREATRAFAPRVLIVRAPDPMWRGGLSGPGSLYLHADRPLREQDGTSPPLHELFHVLTGACSGHDGDWVTEGLAELYSLEAQRRAGLLTAAELGAALAGLDRRGRAARHLRVPNAHGAITARAAVTLHALDRELRARSGGAHGLDKLVRALSEARLAVTTRGFRELAEALTGLDLAEFFAEHVP